MRKVAEDRHQSSVQNEFELIADGLTKFEAVNVDDPLIPSLVLHPVKIKDILFSLEGTVIGEH